VNIIEFFESDVPWFNTADYTTVEIIIFFGAAMFWVWTYLETIRIIRARKTIGIPVIAVCLNFGFEVTTALFFLPNMGKLVVFGYWAWMLLDCYIVYHTFFYGHKQVQVPYMRKLFKPLFLCGVVFAFILEYFFIQSHDIPMSPYDAYIINFTMSTCFLYLAFIKGFEGNSLIIAWTKFLGTGWTSVVFWMKYPENYWLITLYIGTAMMDIFYIYLLYRKKQGRLDEALQQAG
jgi:hypothetical protein